MLWAANALDWRMKFVFKARGMAVGSRPSESGVFLQSKINVVERAQRSRACTCDVCGHGASQ